MHNQTKTTIAHCCRHPVYSTPSHSLCCLLLTAWRPLQHAVIITLDHTSFTCCMQNHDKTAGCVHIKHTVTDTQCTALQVSHSAVGYLRYDALSSPKSAANFPVSSFSSCCVHQATVERNKTGTRKEQDRNKELRAEFKRSRHLKQLSYVFTRCWNTLLCTVSQYQRWITDKFLAIQVQSVNESFEIPANNFQCAYSYIV